MKEIDYLSFKKLLHIQDDDHWLGGESPFLYRIAGGAVRAVPFGFEVDKDSLAPVRPLVRVSNYNHACFESLTGEADELELYNPSGAADAVLFQFPATVQVVSDFLNRADLWWMVDKVLWEEYGLSESFYICHGTHEGELKRTSCRPISDQLVVKRDVSLDRVIALSISAETLESKSAQNHIQWDIGVASREIIFRQGAMLFEARSILQTVFHQRKPEANP